MQGCHGQGKVRENSILFKVREKSASFVSGQRSSNSLFKVREKSGNFILMLLQIILLDVFVHAKQVCFKNYLSHPYFCWFMVRMIILHSQWKLLYSQWKVRDFFCSGGWQPCNEFNSVTRGSFHCSCSSGFSVHERVSMIITIIYYSWIISHQTWIWQYYCTSIHLYSQLDTNSRW